MPSAVDEILRAGANVFFSKGHSSATVADLLESAGVSESTFRRHFKDGKIGVFRGVLEVAAIALYESYLEAVRQAGLDTGTSDPKRLALLYIETVIRLWHSDGIGKLQVGLLFGADGTAAGQSYGKDFLTDAAMQDVKLLDQILTRGCGENHAKAKNISCIVLGTVGEYISGDLDSACGYDRNYDAQGVLDLLDSFLSTALQSQRIPSPTLEREGVTKETLKRLGDELTNCAAAVDRVLRAAD